MLTCRCRSQLQVKYPSAGDGNKGQYSKAGHSGVSLTLQTPSTQETDAFSWTNPASHSSRHSISKTPAKSGSRANVQRPNAGARTPEQFHSPLLTGGRSISLHSCLLLLSLLLSSLFLSLLLFSSLLFSLLVVLREVWPWGSLLRQKQLGD